MMRSRMLLLGTAVAAGCFAMPAHADVVVGPRVSYYFDNSNLRTSALSADQVEGPQIDLETSQMLADALMLDPQQVQVSTMEEGSGVLADQVSFPMVGAMMNFGDDRDRFTLTAMYGQGSGDVEQIFSESSLLDLPFGRIQDVTTLSIDGGVDIDRYDLELTWQRRTSEQFAFFAGARYERLESKANFRFRAVGTNEINAFVADVLGPEAVDGLTDPLALEGDASSTGTLETFSVRAGVTAFVPFSDSAVFFANGMIHASHQPDYTTRDVLSFGGALPDDESEAEAEGETSVGPDLAVGAQFILSQNVALDVRYRAILFFPIAGASDFGDARVNHGVNLGVSFRL